MQFRPRHPSGLQLRRASRLRLEIDRITFKRKLYYELLILLFFAVIAFNRRNVKPFMIALFIFQFGDEVGAMYFYFLPFIKSVRETFSWLFNKPFFNTGYLVILQVSFCKLFSSLVSTKLLRLILSQNRKRNNLSSQSNESKIFCRQAKTLVQRVHNQKKNFSR